MVRKIVAYVFICFVAVFLMSQNVGAITTVYDMSNYKLISSGRTPSIKCYFSDNTSGSYRYCPSTYSKTITGFDLSNTYPNGFNFKKSDLIEFDLSFIGVSGSSLTSFGIIQILTNNSNFSVIDFHVTQDTLDTVSQYMLFDGGTDYLVSDIDAGVITYHVTIELKTDLDDTIFGVAETSSVGFITQSFYSNSFGSLLMGLSNWNVYRKSVSNSINSEQEQKTQEAADASEDAGDTSSDDAEEGTSSLISAIGSAVNVISSASPTNCKINGNMGNLNMGQIDLCANPVPSFIQVIGSLILILITVPLCITLFNRFIALFRSFQG